MKILMFLLSLTLSEAQGSPLNLRQHLENDSATVDFISEQIDTNGTLKEPQPGCIIDNLSDDTGKAVLSRDPCKTCYCIGNSTHCITHTCNLPSETITGCIPVYDHRSCCPLHFNCAHNSDSMALSTQTPMLTEFGCFVNGIYYSDGDALLKHEDPCEKCYCIKEEIVCAKTNCSALMLGCKPVWKEGQCCPARYDCVCMFNDIAYEPGQDILTDVPCQKCYCSFTGNLICQSTHCLTDDVKNIPYPETMEEEKLSIDHQEDLREYGKEIQQQMNLNILKVLKDNQEADNLKLIHHLHYLQTLNTSEINKLFNFSLEETNENQSLANTNIEETLTKDYKNNSLEDFRKIEQESAEITINKNKRKIDRIKGLKGDDIELCKAGQNCQVEDRNGIINTTDGITSLLSESVTNFKYEMTDQHINLQESEKEEDKMDESNLDILNINHKESASFYQSLRTEEPNYTLNINHSFIPHAKEIKLKEEIQTINDGHNIQLDKSTETSGLELHLNSSNYDNETDGNVKYLGHLKIFFEEPENKRIYFKDLLKSKNISKMIENLFKSEGEDNWFPHFMEKLKENKTLADIQKEFGSQNNSEELDDEFKEEKRFLNENVNKEMKSKEILSINGSSTDMGYNQRNLETLDVLVENDKLYNETIRHFGYNEDKYSFDNSHDNRSFRVKTENKNHSDEIQTTENSASVIYEDVTVPTFILRKNSHQITNLVQKLDAKQNDLEVENNNRKSIDETLSSKNDRDLYSNHFSNIDIFHDSFLNISVKKSNFWPLNSSLVFPEDNLTYTRNIDENSNEVLDPTFIKKNESGNFNTFNEDLKKEENTNMSGSVKFELKISNNSDDTIQTFNNISEEIIGYLNQSKDSLKSDSLLIQSNLSDITNFVSKMDEKFEDDHNKKLASNLSLLLAPNVYNHSKIITNVNDIAKDGINYIETVTRSDEDVSSVLDDETYWTIRNDTLRKHNGNIMIRTQENSKEPLTAIINDESPVQGKIRNIENGLNDTLSNVAANTRNKVVEIIKQYNDTMARIKKEETIIDVSNDQEEHVSTGHPLNFQTTRNNNFDRNDHFINDTKTLQLLNDNDSLLLDHIQTNILSMNDINLEKAVNPPSRNSDLNNEFVEVEDELEKNDLQNNSDISKVSNMLDLIQIPTSSFRNHENYLSSLEGNVNQTLFNISENHKSLIDKIEPKYSSGKVNGESSEIMNDEGESDSLSQILEKFNNTLDDVLKNIKDMDIDGITLNVTDKFDLNVAETGSGEFQISSNNETTSFQRSKYFEMEKFIPTIQNEEVLDFNISESFPLVESSDSERTPPKILNKTPALIFRRVSSKITASDRNQTCDTNKTKDCEYDHQNYPDGTTISSSNPCQLLMCIESRIIEVNQSCPKPFPMCTPYPVPGYCCPAYICPTKFSPLEAIQKILTNTTPPSVGARVCRIGAQFLHLGQKIVTQQKDGCLKCICGRLGVTCDPGCDVTSSSQPFSIRPAERDCHFKSGVFSHNQPVEVADPCQNCLCMNGRLLCERKDHSECALD